MEILTRKGQLEQRAREHHEAFREEQAIIADTPPVARFNGSLEQLMVRTGDVYKKVPIPEEFSLAAACKPDEILDEVFAQEALYGLPRRLKAVTRNGDESRFPTTKRDWLNPANWGMLRDNALRLQPGYVLELDVRAKELGADAVVELRPLSAFITGYEAGIPVKKISEGGVVGLLVEMASDAPQLL